MQAMQCAALWSDAHATVLCCRCVHLQQQHHSGLRLCHLGWRRSSKAFKLGHVNVIQSTRAPCWGPSTPRWHSSRAAVGHLNAGVDGGATTKKAAWQQPAGGSLDEQQTQQGPIIRTKARSTAAVPLMGKRWPRPACSACKQAHSTQNTEHRARHTRRWVGRWQGDYNRSKQSRRSASLNCMSMPFSSMLVSRAGLGRHL